MSKISKAKLVDACLTELTAYLRAGESINQSVVAEALEFDQTTIDDLDRLLDIHFTLSSRVGAYLERLPQEIRRVSTATVAEENHSRGQIEGAIDWGRTTEARTATGLQDRTLYVTHTQERSYETAENLVLKALLSHVQTLVTEEIADLDESRRMPVWSDGSLQSYRQLVERNVHLNRIPTVPLERLTPRMLDTARKSRKYLYSEAAALVDLRRKLQDRAIDDPAVRAIFEQTLAAPDVETLFELFCTFRILRWLQSAFPNLSLQHIRTGSEPLAQLRGAETEIRVYHDSQGGLDLTESVDSGRVKPQSPYLRQRITARTTHADIMEQDQTRALFRGQPDLIVEVYRKHGETTALQSVFLGEAKHTAEKSTLSNGVSELLEYLMHARSSDRYLVDDSSVDVFGFVFSDSEIRLQRQPLVTHLTVNEMQKW
ncbi:hypothetical protein [Halogranum rubrum]|uniref:Uncharacterized protein n=1 Tax=Halogranum salarium B-1 TaxID=1210908 RepID=J3EU35_9EURY|nr:hypothetical protein [Halogranum salarium]EJN57792.1 hypothetical protein HSB1_38770 [Halogranum salarium B-1]